MSRRYHVVCPLCRAHVENYKDKLIWHYDTDGVPCFTSGMKVTKAFDPSARASYREWHIEGEEVFVQPKPLPPLNKPTRPPCPTGKRLYDSPEEAVAAAASVTRGNIRKHRSTPAREYKCHLCPHWHVTSMEFVPALADLVK